MTLGNHSDIASTGSNITAKVTVGNYTSVGPYVEMHTLHNHPCIQHREIVSTAIINGYPPTYAKETIKIGSDVWIGRNAVLIGDLIIGDGAIIGAFSVVAKDVPPFAVVVGNPQVIKRYRFSPSQVEQLLKIKWWNWDHEKVEENRADLLNINTFIEKHSII